MNEPLAIAMSAEDFEHYCAVTLPKKMSVWRPRGAVLHNTDAPTLAQFYKGPHGAISGPQRVKNMWESYRHQGWSGGPHLVITDREIILANALWLKGVHSPSYNATFWGIEMAGSYETKEQFSTLVRDNTVRALAALYAMLGHEPDNSTFHFHKEDTRTTHRTCPGKNVGSKPAWIKMIHDQMAKLHPGGCEDCKEHVS